MRARKERHTREHTHTDTCWKITGFCNMRQSRHRARSPGKTTQAGVRIPKASALFGACHMHTHMCMHIARVRVSLHCGCRAAWQPSLESHPSGLVAAPTSTTCLCAQTCRLRSAAGSAPSPCRCRASAPRARSRVSWVPQRPQAGRRLHCPLATAAERAAPQPAVRLRAAPACRAYKGARTAGRARRRQHAAPLQPLVHERLVARQPLLRVLEDS